MEEFAIENDLQIKITELKKAARIFRAINHDLRRQLLQLIHQNKEITVTSIYGELGLEQSVVSQHLAILRQAGLVTTKRDSRFIYYAVDYQRLEGVHFIAAQLLSQ